LEEVDVTSGEEDEVRLDTPLRAKIGAAAVDRDG
jgi:hypothetical protein